MVLSVSMDIGDLAAIVYKDVREAIDDANHRPALIADLHMMSLTPSRRL